MAEEPSIKYTVRELLARIEGKLDDHIDATDNHEHKEYVTLRQLLYGLGALVAVSLTAIRLLL